MRWFRCRECGRRFAARDWFLIQLWLSGGVAAVAIIATLVWTHGVLNGPNQTPAMAGTSSPVTTVDPITLAADAPHDQAWTEIERAAAAGDADAQYQAGVAIVRRAWQRGEQFILVDAADWIRQAADQDHNQAQVLLGSFYEKGRGVIQDYEQAIDWYQRAALAGNPLAMARLGKMLAEGRGSEADIARAYAWLNLAAARGLSNAEHERSRLKARLSSEQFSHAQQESRRLNQTLPRLIGESQELPAGY